MADPELFEYAQSEERTIVSYNRDDFLTLDRRYRSQRARPSRHRDRPPATIPAGTSATGRLVAALAGLLATEPRYPGFVHWLQLRP